MSSWDTDILKTTLGGDWLIEPTKPELEFAGVSIDSRTIQPDQVFFAFVGERVDGHGYLDQAQEAGASLCVVSEPARVPTGFEMPTMVVDDVLVAMTRMASAWRDRIRARVIGITGSNGKTTTCRLLHSVCAQSGSSVVSQKSYNNALGVPITLLNTPEDADYLVAELGTSSKGEIAARSRLLRPDLAIITSIGSAHLEELGDRSGVSAEKWSIVDGLGEHADPPACVVVPKGIAELELQIEQGNHSARVVRVDLDAVCDVQSMGDQTGFVFDGHSYTIPMIGAHNVGNSMLAIVAARALGIDAEGVVRGLEAAQPPEMRLERVELDCGEGKVVLYNDAYNANPDSMRAALRVFDEIECGGRKVAVIGEMLELGSASADEHARLVDELGRYATIDRWVLVGDSFSACESTRGMCIIPACDSPAIERVGEELKEGDTVLLKGSRGIGLERVIGQFEPEAINSEHIETS
ncbi:MAG: UDP-N-acetylmuramoyl-tripeptide--D-alanyl-D-alanine ligase [Phycisphaerales bacterium]